MQKMSCYNAFYVAYSTSKVNQKNIIFDLEFLTSLLDKYE